MDKNLFACACEKIVNRERNRCGIGTLGEKTIHAVLKQYFEPDESRHEIRLCGYVADIAGKNKIIEIQTRNFNALRKKLEVFLEYAPVTIVYPVPATKWLCWMDEETGEISNKRKSPKRGNPYQIFPELYKIKEYLANPNLSLCIILIDMEEYRLLNGWSADKKKGSTRFDRIPKELIDEIYINQAKDYKKLIPSTLGEVFTSADYKKESHITLTAAQTSLNILYHMGSVKRVGKKGNSYLYERC